MDRVKASGALDVGSIPAGDDSLLEILQLFFCKLLTVKAIHVFVNL